MNDQECSCGTHATCLGAANNGNRFCFAGDFGGKGVCFDRAACPAEPLATKEECKCGETSGNYSDPDAAVQRCNIHEVCSSGQCTPLPDCKFTDGKTKLFEDCVCGQSTNRQENCQAERNGYCWFSTKDRGECLSQPATVQ
eukprot:TRINITY_DN38583_c0_g1_i3.p1 TRINITY_DN38583_c0_g1~~TRINITY_DN38583_c0_g1_i3.p1  ORF type:complete len:141 (-),score=28.87 TRINITY_DN38583_c0_g1_i3:283-705(-)